MKSIQTRRCPERVDTDDPTLIVDDLDDFLTARTTAEDPTLAVNGLEELFPEQDDNELETFVRQLEAASTEAVLTAGHDALRSEIQRAAVEFEHFAEAFHAFASECHERDGY